MHTHMAWAGGGLTYTIAGCWEALTIFRRSMCRHHLSSPTHHLLLAPSARQADLSSSSSAMGSVASKTPEPVHRVLLTRPGYEIRSYQPYVVAEVVMASDRAQDHSFRTLASYIGVFRSPENKAASSGKPEAIPMTAPVVFANAEQPVSIPMTAPVVFSGQTMQFVLPHTYKTSSEAPVPTNPDVHLKDVAGQLVAVIQYGGYSNPDIVADKLKQLKALCAQDGFIDSPDADATYQYCGYDPPFKPIGRRNEVWLHLAAKKEEDILAFNDKQQKKDSATTS